MESNQTPDYPLFTPTQIGTAALIGGPLPGCWLLVYNYKKLGEPGPAATWAVSGVIAEALLITLVLFVLPAWFPPYVLPLACGLGLQGAAKNLQGSALKDHDDAGGGLGSWWIAIGAALLGLIVFAVSIYLLLFLFPSLLRRVSSFGRE